MNKIKTHLFDVVTHLTTNKEIAAYLELILEDNNGKLLAATLGDIVRIRGITQLAKDTGLSCESLYKELSGEIALSADTLLKMIYGLGFKISLQPQVSTP